MLQIRTIAFGTIRVSQWVGLGVLWRPTLQCQTTKMATWHCHQPSWWLQSRQPTAAWSNVFNWTGSLTNKFHVFKHYTELVPNGRREMTDCYGPFVPPYLAAFTVHTDLSSTGGPNYCCLFQKTENSALPPILNAIEIYTLLQLSNNTSTAQRDGMLLS